MGTSNFHTANAGATYVIDYGDDEYMWSECQEYLADWIKELDSSFESDTYLKSEQELRSFPASSIGYWNFELEFLNLTFKFRINLFIRSGYYDAANLDYEFQWYLEGCDYYKDAEQILSEIDYNPEAYDVSPGIWAIHKSNLKRKLDILESLAIAKVESILPQISTPYGVIAQFSNGETFYGKLDS